ncbi:hypothetical protein SAMN04489807_1882 [Microbacterium hydrocarbonoxydans]|uniref:Uncharacterized protein n=1 Tax=Microbacterium hydrocarbonoxydans TaxID=273678 RepID=A0A1H4LSL0_9MICO|nr:hypothetical protein SAMN04489807_1882 [Microbacterium hydrocarbonoxydans]
MLSIRAFSVVRRAGRQTSRTMPIGVDCVA